MSILTSFAKNSTKPVSQTYGSRNRSNASNPSQSWPPGNSISKNARNSSNKLAENAQARDETFVGYSFRVSFVSQPRVGAVHEAAIWLRGAGARVAAGKFKPRWGIFAGGESHQSFRSVHYFFGSAPKD